eukprot:19640-Eustigmatos_ZCMA.PRE.1
MDEKGFERFKELAAPRRMQDELLLAQQSQTVAPTAGRWNDLRKSSSTTKARAWSSCVMKHLITSVTVGTVNAIHA